MDAMTREELLSGLKAQTELFRAEGVRHVALFGSQARGDARPDSDIDLFVEYEPERRISTSDLIRLEQTLSERFGREVQVTKSPVRSTYLRKAIAAESLPVL
jgi:uncharacterized protein